MLKAQGASRLYDSNVIKIELDYFRHKSQQDHYLTDYIAKQSLNAKTFLNQVHDFLKNRDVSTVSTYETPIIYLQAIYDAILSDPNAAVVSSAFYTESSGFSVLPPNFSSANKPITISAVSNDPNYIETFTLEPIQSLYSKRHDDAVLLVGGLSNGKAFGMRSQSGDGVSVLGNADGWGGGDSCIQPSDVGTSFATPQIGTIAFLVSSALRDQRTTLTALQLRDRLLRSAQIHWNDPPAYSSPGVPDATWATAGRIGALIDAHGNMKEIASASGSVRFSYPGETDIYVLPIKTGDKGISGIQTSGNDSLIFDNAKQRWFKVDVASVVLDISTSTSELIKAQTTAEFLRSVQAFALF